MPRTATYDRTGGKKRIPEGKIFIFPPFTATARPDSVPRRSRCFANPITCLIRRHWRDRPTRLCTPPLALRKPPASPQNTYRLPHEKRFSGTSAADAEAGSRCGAGLPARWADLRSASGRVDRVVGPASGGHQRRMGFRRAPRAVQDRMKKNDRTNPFPEGRRSL